MNTQDYIAREAEHSANNYAPLPVVIAKGQGVWVWDVEGKKYLDCLSGYSSLNQGHCNPRIVKAIKEQAETLTLTARAFHNDKMGPFLEKLCKVSGMDKALPMNSGAEAVETAIKAVRKWGYKVKGIPEGRAEIVTCNDNFHGRTTTIVGFSSEAQNQDGFGPFTPGFKIIDFGDLEQLENAITENTAAFIVEPIQGEGGIIIPPKGYITKAKEICHRHNVLFILDEVQSGLGRTGKMFAYMHEPEAKPDGMMVAKALSGGCYPISAFLASDELMAVFEPGDHGSTFGGNPLASAIGMAALDCLIEDGMIEQSVEQGEYLLNALKEIDSPYVKEVRGIGLWIGIELHPEAGPAKAFCKKLMHKGILVKDTREHVIRLSPPLVIERPEIELLIEAMTQCLTEDNTVAV